MPGQDGTGPLGQGPLTGRGLGPCGRGLAIRRDFGRGFGRGLGFRRGFGNIPVITEAEEKQELEAELKEIEAEKAEIEKRLKEIKSK